MSYTEKDSYRDIARLFENKDVPSAALTLLSTPSSSDSAERLFSAMGNIIGNRRSRLNDKALKAELLFKFNTAFALEKMLI